MSPCLPGSGFQANHRCHRANWAILPRADAEVGESAERQSFARLLRRINQTAHAAHSSWDYLDSAIVCGRVPLETFKDLERTEALRSCFIGVWSWVPCYWLG